MHNDNNYELQNILHYSRKSAKKNRDGISIEAYVNGRREEVKEDVDSPRGERVTMNSAGCSCDIDTDGEIARILHKKCPVIALAQQQLQRLLDDTDKLLSENITCCRSTYEFLMFFKEYLLDPNKYRCVLFILIILAFFIGLIFGASTCGSCLRKFNSPILRCIDNFFIYDTYSNIEETFKAVV